MKKVLIGFLIFMIVVVVLLVGVAAYVGLIPGLSNKLVKKVDLGVENDPQLVTDLFEDFEFEDNIDKEKLPHDGDFVYSGVVRMERTMSSEEVTSYLNYLANNASYTPFNQLQIRFNEDETIEVSLDADVNKLAELALDLGYSQSDIEKGKKYLDILGGSVYMYAKFEADVNNNDIQFTGENLRLQNFTVPSSLYEPIGEAIASMIESYIPKVSGLDLEKITQEGDRLDIKADIPASVSVDE